MIGESNGCAGGPYRGAIYRVIVWAVCQGLICWGVHPAVVAHLPRAGIGVGGGRRRAVDAHDILVVVGGDGREALVVLLSVFRRRALPGPLVVVGADHPPCGAVGAGHGADADYRGRLEQEKGRPAH